MTDKTTPNSSYYYREPGKHVMGPLPLGTLKDAMQSGSLNQRAEVSRDGNEPWASLTSVLENRDRAFVQHKNAGSGNRSVKHATESKGMRPRIVVVMVAGALGLGALAMNYFGRAERANDRDSAPKAGASDVKVTKEQVKAAAVDCLFWAQMAIGSKQELEAAEVELSEQRSAGESQLKAIKLQEVKNDREKAIKDFEEKIDELASLEEKAGISHEYSEALKDLVRYGERLATRAELTKKYKSILDPKYKAQYDEFRHLRYKIELHEVLAGSYKNGFGADNL